MRWRFDQWLFVVECSSSSERPPCLAYVNAFGFVARASFDMALVKAAYLSIVVTGVHVNAEPIHSLTSRGHIHVWFSFDRRSAYSSDFDVGFEGEMISRRKREHSSPRKPLGEGPLSPKHFLGLQHRPFNDSSCNTTDGRISLNRASRYTVSILMGLHLSVLGARVKGHSRVSRGAILEGVQHRVPTSSCGLKADIFLDGNESIHPEGIHCTRVQQVENNSSDRNENL
ncbi:hypothetical protein PSHT_14406 [Puccinia striiformis]|uniref:Uncharacterized protein n=1 Tax=Puccinia striiformis TaxID=27350 RepID=A0A2S4UKJ5_9BASI|nr:hypothetical protein PSHT_14406 [Puccinia striiformis]